MMSCHKNEVITRMDMCEDHHLHLHQLHQIGPADQEGGKEKSFGSSHRKT